ncbi:Minichromosome maintenance domain-containing protein 2 [Blomia tropicalis]|nr:Minichromosome maintenance domain-containing protein 2 [Blomia tropicalis]
MNRNRRVGIMIGRGQIISLSELKIRRHYSYRKANFKCLPIHIRFDHVGDDEDDNDESGIGSKFSNMIDNRKQMTKKQEEDENNNDGKMLKLIFSTKFISDHDRMQSIYLGATLVNIYGHSSISSSTTKTTMSRHCLTYYVVSFEPMVDSIQHSFFNNSKLEQSINQRRKNAIKMPDESIFNNLSIDIKELYQYHAHNRNQYGFLFSMVYVFASNITESGSFFRLKLALMMSLVSLDIEPKNDCSLLVLCDDDLVVNRLFEWSCNLSEKHFLYSSRLHSLAGNLLKSSEPSSSVKADRSNRAYESAIVNFYNSSQFNTQATQPLDPFNQIIIGGTLNLASDGIHPFTSAINLDQLPKKERAFLEHALESNEIIPKELKATNVEITESRLKTIIWANVPYAIEENENRFGFAFQTKRLKLSSKQKQQQQNWDSIVWSGEDWRQYFIQCNNQSEPSISDDVEQLIRNYFMINRRYRQQFPLKSITIIRNSSKCLAKLNLRNHVTRMDCILSIILYEQQLIQIYPNWSSIFVDQYGFMFRDLTHLTANEENEDNDVGHDKMKRNQVQSGYDDNSAMLFQNGEDQQRKADNDMSSLLNDSYLHSFEYILMNAFHCHNV